MRPQDKKIILEAAHEYKAWILVRRTNPASLQYIGRPGYAPKRIDCKAKTADLDVSSLRLAGLVVDPVIHPQAFKAGKAAKAEKCWKDMRHVIGTIYKSDSNKQSRHYGCLQLNGAYIHGDYDLYDIIEVSQPHRNLAAVEMLLGQPHKRGHLVLTVQKFVNTRIGVEMIQHGGETQYTDHSEQSIDAFGPDGEDLTLLNELTVRHWYQERFQGRQTLGG